MSPYPPTPEERRQFRQVVDSPGQVTQIDPSLGAYIVAAADLRLNVERAVAKILAEATAEDASRPLEAEALRWAARQIQGALTV